MTAQRPSLQCGQQPMSMAATRRMKACASSRIWGLAPAAKTERLAQARQLLAMPAANPQMREDAQAFMRRVAAIDIGCCPHCKLGRWAVIACVLPQRADLTGAAC